MGIDLRWALAGVALVATGCGEAGQGNDAAPVASAPVAAVPPPAGVASWAEVMSETPEGGIVMGNPDAPVKLVEYASFTCSHCAQFAAEGAVALRDDYVANGKVAWEFRHYVRDPLDMTIGLLARCQGPRPFFKLAEQAFEAQSGFLDRAQRADPATMQRIATLSQKQQFAGYAGLVGVDQFFRVRGLPQAKADACFADQATVDKLVAMRDDGNAKRIPGTPAFFMNGNLVEATSWATLEPKLRAATGQ